MSTESLIKHLYAVLLVFLFLGFKLIGDGDSMGPLLLLSTPLGAICVHRIGKKLLQRDAALEEKFDADLKRELAKWQSANYKLFVQGSRHTFFAVLIALLGLTIIALLAVAAISGARQAHDLLIAVIGLLMLLSSLPRLWRAWRLRGVPFATLSARGFETPLHGLIPWDAVQGIDIGEEIFRKNVYAYSLRFFVPELPRYAVQFDAMTRFLSGLQLSRGRQVIRIQLSNLSDNPEIVEQVAKQLWLAATGRNHLWDPNAPDWDNEQMRLASVPQPVASQSVYVATPLPAQALVTAQHDSDTLMEKERARVATEWHWIFIAIAVIILLAMLAKYGKRMF
jgi:hypothetical protein